MGDYNGKYYPYTNRPVVYRGMRPFYLLVIADTPVMDRMAAQSDYAELMRPSQARNSYRINQAESNVDYCVVSGWQDDAGRYRVSHKEEGLLTKCEPDKQTGIFCITLAANLGGLQQTDAYLTNAANYDVKAQTDFALRVTPITDKMITGNNRQYLEGKTHLLTLTGKLTAPRDEVIVRLRNEFPQWVIGSSSNDDTNPNSANFSTTTLGLEQWMRGMQDAFGATGDYTTLRLRLEK
jgi:hypothetical protein